MIAEIGHLALWLALFAAAGQVFSGALGVTLRHGILMAAAPAFALTQAVCAALAFVMLALAFLRDDFSLAYVAANSNSLLPEFYKLAAVWGAHEGSFLLWILIMSLWTLAVAMDTRLPLIAFKTAMLVVMGALSCGFLLFSLLTSSPFDRLLPFSPVEGADLNPQLQDFGLIVHPPMLYLGYIGFSVAFAFAIASLWLRPPDAETLRWLRPWTNAAWCFLGLGIVLGSWWAYYELGWGGWWFWDAVENASLIPWLAGTALIHSLAVSEKRGFFGQWTLLLAILVFSFSLLGAFLVRSGVLISVHAFASDPERGLFMLIFLVVVVGSALLLYFFRFPPSIAGNYGLWSRETFLLTNNHLLAAAAGTVLLGTLFPLVYESLSGGRKLSVGPPYFNLTFLPLAGLLALALALGPLMRWSRTPVRIILRQVAWLTGISLTAGLLLPLLLSDAFNPSLMLTSALAFWIFGGLWMVIRHESFVRNPSASRVGMCLAHAGFVVCLIGVGFSSTLSQSKNVLLNSGQETTLAGYHFRFEGVVRQRGANYLADVGILKVSPPPLLGWFSRSAIDLRPEKRLYPVRGNVMTEAAISPGLWLDLYATLGSPVGEGWSMQLHYKPFIRWIWLGGVLMALGGLIPLFGRRYRRVARES